MRPRAVSGRPELCPSCLLVRGQVSGRESSRVKSSSRAQCSWCAGARRRRVVQILQTDTPPIGNIWASIQILQNGLGALERAVSCAKSAPVLTSSYPDHTHLLFSSLSSLALRPAMLWLPPSYRPNNPYARPHHTCSLQLIRARLILDSLTGGHSVTEPRRQLVGGLC